MPYKDKQLQSNYTGAWARGRIALGLCSICQVTRTRKNSKEQNARLCDGCAAKHREANRRHSVAKRLDHVARGLCSYCDAPIWEGHSRSFCKRHLLGKRASKARARERAR
jgi:hypothetical protein